MLTNEAGVRFMRADARLQEILPIWTKTPDTDWAPADGTQGSDQPSYVRSDYYYVPTPDGSERNRFTLEGYRADMDYYKQRGEYLNGLSNPANWNTGRLLRWVKEAKAQGYEVMVRYRNGCQQELLPERHIRKRYAMVRLRIGKSTGILLRRFT